MSRRRIECYRAGNLEAAALILADPEQFGGEESGLARWARLVLDGEQERLRLTRNNVQEARVAGHEVCGRGRAAGRPYLGEHMSPRALVQWFILLREYGVDLS